MEDLEVGDTETAPSAEDGIPDWLSGVEPEDAPVKPPAGMEPDELELVAGAETATPGQGPEGEETIPDWVSG